MPKDQVLYLNHACAHGCTKLHGLQYVHASIDVLQCALERKVHASSAYPLVYSGKSANDFLILPQKKKDGPKSGSGTEQQQPQPPPSKSELRKLKQIQMKNERRQNISQGEDVWISCTNLIKQLSLQAGGYDQRKELLSHFSLKGFLALLRQGAVTSLHNRSAACMQTYVNILRGLDLAV
eukprot:scaffold4714_cov19-Tisochrysis_lutea.AAC.1